MTEPIAERSQKLGSNPKTQLTQRSWTASRSGAPGEYVVRCFPDEFIAVVLGHDNAQLIAAAPRMHEALEEALEALDNYSDVVDGPEGRQLPNKAMRALQVVKEAIALAGGGK